MFHCPNEDQPFHPANADIRIFAEAIVEMNNEFLVQEFIEFPPSRPNCGSCMAGAQDDEQY